MAEQNSGRRPRWICRLGLALASVAIAGCTSVDRRAVRTAQRDEFLAGKQALVAALPERGPLDLAAATELALRHNLALQAARMERRLATIDREAAFSYFLPQVNLQLRHGQYGDAPAIFIGGVVTQTGDAHFSRLALDFQQPLFVPQAWFMYAMRQKNEDISQLVLDRTRQFIEFEVAVRYFDYLATRDMEVVTRQGIVEAETLAGEITSLRKRSLAMPSQQLQAEATLAARQSELRNNLRDQVVARAALLTTLGLPPLSEVEFVYADMPSAPPGPPDQLIGQALVNRLELQVADRSVEIAHDNVRRAVVAFLPTVSLFAAYSYNTDTFLAEAASLISGIDGIMSVFDGFRNVAEYRRAKVERERAFLAREQQCFAVMMEVVRAHAALARETDSITVAEKSLEAAELYLKETRARAREGLLPASDLLDAVTTVDRARTRLTGARFRLHVATVSLQHAVESNPFPSAQAEPNDAGEAQ